MAGKKIGLVLALDGEKEFTQALQNAKKETNLYKTELKNLSQEFSENANSMNALKAKQEALAKQQDAYQRKLNTAKAGLDNAKKAYNQQSDALEDLRKRLEEAKKAQQKMEDAGDTTSDAYKNQCKQVDELSDAVDKQNVNVLKASGRVTDWNKKVSESEGELKKANKALDQNEQYLKEAESATDHCATSIDNMGKQVKDASEDIGDAKQKISDFANTLEDAGDKTDIFEGVLKGNLAGSAITKGLEIAAKGAEAVKESMYDISGASANLTAKTGATTQQMESYKSVMLSIRGNNFGEDYRDVSDAMAVVIQTMGELNETELKDVTENAITLRDTFDMDYQESLRAVKMLTDQFGVSSEQAFNLIVQGAQQGLNKNGDLLDTINEYSVHYSQMGVSAEDFFNSLKNGTDAGTFSVDKLGDAYKEFGIRVKDTATTTDEAYKLLGLDADEMRGKFAKGGDSAKEATEIVLNALFNMDDEVKQNQAGVDLFGTMWEDLGLTGVKALTNIEGGISSIGNAMDDLKSTKYSDLETAVSGLGAAVQENIVAPIADKALPVITGLFQKATDVVNGIGDAVSPQKDALEQCIDDTKKMREEVEQTLNAANDSVGDAEASAAKIGMLGDQLLNLNSIEEMSAGQRYRLKEIVNQLSADIPELTNAYNEESGKVELSDNAIKNLISTKKELLVVNAMEAAMQEEANTLAESTVVLEKAKIAAEAANEERDYWEGLNQSLMELNDTWVHGDFNGESLNEYVDRVGNIPDALKQAFDDGKISLEEYEEAMKELQSSGNDVYQFMIYTGQKTSEYSEIAGEAAGEIEELEKAHEELQTGYDRTAKAVENGVNSLEQEEDALNDNSDAADDNADSQEQLGKAASQTAEEIKAAADSIIKSTEASAETQKEATKSILDTYHGYVDEIKSDLQDKINPFEKFDTADSGEDLTVEEMTKNLESQNEAFERYAERLAAVKERVGKEISPEFMKYLESMGMEGDNTLKHILATLDETPGEFSDKVKAFNDEYLRSLDLTGGIAEVGAANKIAYEAAMGELGSTDVDFSELRDSIDVAVSSAAEGWNNPPEATKTALEQTVQAAKECGIKIPDGLAEGIASGEISPQEAISQLKGSIEGTFEGLSEMAKEAGIEVPPELAAGVKAGGQEAVDAISQLVQQIAGKSPELQKAIEDGAKTDGVKSSVESSVKPGADAITEAAPTYREKSKALGESIGKGIEEWSKQIPETVTNALKSGADAIAEQKESYVQAGTSLGEAVSEGLQQSLEADSGSVILNPDSISDKEGDYQAAGRTLGEAVVSGLQEQQKNINDALSPDAESITGKAGDYQAAGEQLGTALAEGLTSKANDAQNSGKVLSDATLSSIMQQLSQMQEAGRAQAQAYANAISAARGQAASAGSSLGSAAYNGAASYSGSFYSVGINMAAGLASGINAGASHAINAAANMAGRALSAAKARLEIHSPSKKFERDVGRQISAGTAFGISKNASLASSAADKMSKKVYAKATVWLTKYKKTHKVSLADEQWYWQQVAAHAKKGTAAYNNAAKKASIAGLRKNGLTYELAKSVVNKFGVSQYTTEGTGKNKKTVKKDAETYYRDIQSAAQTYFDNYKTLHTVSAKQELTYWQGVQKRLKKGTQAWYDAQKEINSAKEAITQAEADKRAQTARNQQILLDNYKIYYKMSEKAEVQYWDKARKQFKAGTQERIDADTKYLEAKQAYYERLEELDTDYKEKYQEINDELEKSVNELTDAYSDAVKSRKNEIMSSMDLFEAFDATGYDGNTLLYNLETQVKGLALWEQQLEELGQKGVTGALMEELQSLGPDAAANIWSLNQMTKEQLDQYVKLWEQKAALANSQAIKENEPLRNETNEQISQLKKDAEKELAELNKTYKESIKQTTESISTELSALISKAGKVGEDAVAGLVKGIKKQSDSVDAYKHTNAAVNTLSDGLEELVPQGELIGKNTLDGLLAGLQDEDKIKKASVNVVNSIKRAMENEAEIHSPSRLFNRAIGLQMGAGVGTGLKESAETLEDTSRDVIRNTLAAAQKELANQQASLSADMAILDTSGITALNNALTAYQPAAPIVNVDNSSVAGMMQQFMTGMQTMVEIISGMGVYINEDVLVGQIQPALSQESAAVTIRRNRGRR